MKTKIEAVQSFYFEGKLIEVGETCEVDPEDAAQILSSGRGKIVAPDTDEKAKKK